MEGRSLASRILLYKKSTAPRNPSPEDQGHVTPDYGRQVDPNRRMESTPRSESGLYGDSQSHRRWDRSPDPPPVFPHTLASEQRYKKENRPKDKTDELKEKLDKSKDKEVQRKENRGRKSDKHDNYDNHKTRTKDKTKKSLARYTNLTLSDANRADSRAKNDPLLDTGQSLALARKIREEAKQYQTSPPPSEAGSVSRAGSTTSQVEDQWHDQTIDEDWQTGKSLKECNQYMLTYEVDSDVTFIVGEHKEEIKSHRYILMSRNAKMNKILLNMRRDERAIISVPEIKPETFRILLTYLYTDDVTLTVPLALSLLQPSYKFGVNDLKTACFQFLLSEMYSENVCQIFEQTHLYNEQNIHDSCRRFILVNAEDVLKTPNFKELCRDCVKEILSSDELNTDELVACQGAITWANGECSRQRISPNDKNRRQVLGDLLYTVRFPLMNVDMFTQKLSHSELLKSDEKVALFQFFHGETDRLPAQFNRRERKRYYENPRFTDNTNRSFSRNAYSVPFSPGLESNRKLPVSTEDILPNYGNLNRVMRFRRTSGQWLTNGPDAISFRCSSAIILHGVQIFGPGNDSDQYEILCCVYDDTKTEIRHDRISLSTNRAKLYQLNLTQPVRLPANRIFTVLVHLKGNPTIRGSDGMTLVSTGGVDFEFINSNRSANGTDVNAGQIPALMFSAVNE